MIEPFLVSYLLGDSGIAATVANTDSPATYRIDPEILKQKEAVPALTYSRISSVYDELADGSGASLIFALFQITAWAADVKTAATLAARARLRMQGLGGDAGGNLQKVCVEDERSGYEPDTLLYYQQLDIRIAYAESSPQ